MRRVNAVPDDDDKRTGRVAGRRKIDWEAAQAYFLSDLAISYGMVARRFGVSDTAVRKHAHADGWEDQRRELQARLAQQLQDGLLGTLEERNRETLLLIRKGVRGLASSDEIPKWSDLPGLVKLEQLIEGEATDRLSVPDVSRFAVELTRGLDMLLLELAAELPDGRRRTLVAGWRRRAPEILEAASAGLVAIGGNGS